MDLVGDSGVRWRFVLSGKGDADPAIAVWIYDPKMDSSESFAATFGHTPEEPETSEPETFPLYDDEPFEPTFVEKGDSSYYTPPFD